MDFTWWNIDINISTLAVTILHGGGVTRRPMRCRACLWLGLHVGGRQISCLYWGPLGIPHVCTMARTLIQLSLMFGQVWLRG